MLTLSVSVVPLRFQKVLFFLSLYLVAVGEGGHKPCVQTFGADQFDEDKLEEKRAKSSFFNWWFFGICGGASAGMLIVFYVQDNVGWVIGFGIPSFAMAFALVLFLFGRRLYRRQVPMGSPVVQVVQVFVAACCKRHLCVSKDGYEVLCSEDGGVVMASNKGRTRSLTRTDQFRCLDKATIIDEFDALSDTRNNWRVCSVTQVEELKLLLGLVPIWLSCLMFAVTQAQGATFFTKQGSSMDTRMGHNFHVPPASLQVTTSLAVIFTVPIYDRILVPTARHFTGLDSGISKLQRIGIGMFVSISAMVVAGLVEARRIQIATKYDIIDHPDITVPMSIWWLLPQYVIVGVSDVFTVVGLQELFYDKIPDGMRSIGSAAYLSVFGVGSLLSSVVISVVQFVSSRAGDEWLGNNLNRAHLDYYYWLLAGLSGIWLCLYLVVSKCFLYKKTI
ncbi:Proton-dependent oligopeptide transporter family [Macleaya cordata]|uniref:Proton-dependent oligopeptide transporter family n=1 Tax=Macleaya cordata TaxID=56857 RepID=A0A200Q867_MACCD|nr:Proton-dependent oligopeptide transporter family [Macleaya cordata]